MKADQTAVHLCSSCARGQSTFGETSTVEGDDETDHVLLRLSATQQTLPVTLPKPCRALCHPTLTWSSKPEPLQQREFLWLVTGSLGRAPFVLLIDCEPADTSVEFHSAAKHAFHPMVFSGQADTLKPLDVTTNRSCSAARVPSQRRHDRQTQPEPLLQRTYRVQFLQMLTHFFRSGPISILLDCASMLTTDVTTAPSNPPSTDSPRSSTTRLGGALSPHPRPPSSE